MNDNASFRFDSIEDADSIRDLLDAIRKGLKKGRLTFSDGEEKFQIRPSGLLDVKVTADKADGLERFSIKVSWRIERPKPDRKKHLSVS